MIFASPFWFLGLLPVVAVAAWVFVRPTRIAVMVGSLALWRQASARAGMGGRKRSQRIPRGWLLLLTGAALAVLALARPVYVAQPAARWISVGVCRSGEFGLYAQPLTREVSSLLNRLAPTDRVQLLWPAELGGAGAWQSPAEARGELRTKRGVQLLPTIFSPTQNGVPALAREILPLPPASEDAQRIVWFVPAGAPADTGPDVIVIEVPYTLPAVTFDALAGDTRPDGQAEIFVRLRNHTATPWRGALGATTFPLDTLKHISVEIPAGRTGQYILVVPAGDRIWVKAGQLIQHTRAVPYGNGNLIKNVRVEEISGVGSWLRRIPKATVRVAILGQPSPMLQRYIQADALLELVATAQDADVVLADGVNWRGEKPALVIAPPNPPPGWENAPPLENLPLGEFGVAVDDPVMRGVNTAGVAVRFAQPWRASETAAGKPLVLGNDWTLILRTTPETSPSGNVPRRVYVAFEISQANTNVVEDPVPFLTLLANAIRWLAPARQDQGVYVSPSSPREPFKFRDIIHCLPLGLRQHEPKIPVREAVAATPLPAPRASKRNISLWPWLTLAAGLCWILGWMRQSAIFDF